MKEMNFVQICIAITCGYIFTLFYCHEPGIVLWCLYLFQAFSGLDEAVSHEAKLMGNTALDAALNAQFLVQIGVFTAVPMIVGFILELGLLQVNPYDCQAFFRNINLHTFYLNVILTLWKYLQAVFSFITMQLQLCSVFFTFSLGTRTHYFGRTILHGGAKVCLFYFIYCGKQHILLFLVS